MRLNNQVAIITGASRGIGKALAVGFAQEGAAVACAARTTIEIDTVAADIQAAGGRAMAVTTDVTDFQAVEALFDAVLAEFGPPDSVVVNAGVNLDPRPIENSNAADWQATLNINLTGAYHCAKAAIPHMKGKGGRIIMVGSGLGHRSLAGRAAYAASKAGLWMLTRVLAEELLPYQIAVNELIPGPVHTKIISSDIAAKLPEDEWYKQPEDVLPLALFLAEQPLNGPTGQSFSLMRRDSQ